MKKVLIFFLTLMLISGCSTISFNERYKDADWNKIIIAPFEGKMANIAEREFEHALAISNNIDVVPTSIVMLQLREHKLDELYSVNAMEAIIKLAKIMNADGIIVGEVEGYAPSRISSSDLAASSASIHAKLLDVKNLNTVVSSQQNESSIFIGVKALMESVSQKSVEEFQEGLSLIK